MTGSYRTYYVNQKTGRDSNDGLTMDSPFASLFQVNLIGAAEKAYYTFLRRCVV